MRRSVLVSVFGVFALLLSIAHAQVTTGTISGTITDGSGAVVSGAKITVQSEETGITRSVTTDSAGRYLVPQLGLGNYKITTTMEGFQTEVRSGVVLTVGREAVVNVQLSVGAVTQTVEVAGEAPLVETTQATMAYLVNDRTVRELPLNGRDLAQLVLLNPGVAEAVNGSGGSAFNGWGRKVSISGSRAEDSAYLLDGSYINDMNHHIPSGPSGALLGVETVREFEVLTNSFGAQYGRTMGGVLNAVSKSGTNEFHGGIYEFLRNSALDARSFFDRQSSPSDPRLPPFRKNQFGGTVGGPIAKDKAFFFLAYEGMRQRYTETRSNVVPDTNARLGILPTTSGGTTTLTVSERSRPYLNLFPLPTPGGRNFGGGTAEYIFTANTPTRDDFGQGRVDYQISGSDSFFGRLTASNSDETRPQSYPGFNQLPYMRTRLLTVSETHIFSPNLLLIARVSFNRVNPGDGATRPSVPAALESIPGEGPPDISPGSGITGYTGYGTPGDYFITNRFQYQGDLNHTVGAHALKYGGLVERLQFNQSFPNRMFGVWQFADLNNFLQGIPNRFRGAPFQFGDPVTGTRQWFYAAYIQDDWKVSNSLTLNIGVRYEPYTVPTEVNGKLANQRNLMDLLTRGDPLWKNSSWKDFGPRFGFAYSPGGTGTTAIRGGFGISYLANDPNVYRNQLGRNVLIYPELDFAVTASANFFPNGLAQIANFRTEQFGQNVAITYNSFKTPRVLQYNVNVQQQIGSDNVLSVGYTGSRGINQTSFGDYNTPTAVWDGVSLAYPVGATRFNPRFDAINYTAANSNAWYSGATVSFQRRPRSGLQTSLSYTWSRAISISDTAQRAEYSGGGGAILLYAHNPAINKSLTGFHVGHTFSVNYSYTLPFGQGMAGIKGLLLSGWQLTGIISAQSGQPFTLTRTTPTGITSITAAALRPNRDLSVPYDRLTSGTTAGCTGVAAGQKLGTPDLYFDPCGYSAPGARSLGNEGMNTLLAPGQFKLDTGITKDTAITERWRLQFRAEAFNLTNHANFAKPSSGLFTGAGARVGSASRITGIVGSARQMQLSLKLMF